MLKVDSMIDHVITWDHILGLFTSRELLWSHVCLWMSHLTCRKRVRMWFPDSSGSFTAFGIQLYNLFGSCIGKPKCYLYNKLNDLSLFLHITRLVCLYTLAKQEVEMREYVAFFQPKLEEHGYHGVFAPKSRAHTKSPEERMDVDGCAIFYKTKKLVELYFELK